MPAAKVLTPQPAWAMNSEFLTKWKCLFWILSNIIFCIEKRPLENIDSNPENFMDKKEQAG
jgi:hypothetical protein